MWVPCSWGPTCQKRPWLCTGDAQIDMMIKTKLRPTGGTSQLQTLLNYHNALQSSSASAAVKAVLDR